MVELDELEQRMMREHTEKRPCVVDGCPDAHTVWLRVGVQQFCVTSQASETADEADWTRAMLAKALANVVRKVPNVKLSGAAASLPRPTRTLG